LVTKRLIDVDDELLAEAQKRFGAKTIKETVNRALDEYIKLELRRDHIDQHINIDGLDLDDPEVIKGAWRSGGRRS
jgi:Arc/MetJ family transcription regulator